MTGHQIEHAHGVRPSTAPDLIQARQFLHALAPDTSARFAFRTFDDRGDDHRLATKCFGTLDKGVRQSTNPAKNGKSCRAHSFLRYMSGLGAGVFVTINGTDGAGQTKSNIISVRALFVDCDDDAALLQLKCFLPATGLEPTAIVASGGLTASGADKLQVYWSIKNCPLDQFKPAQLALSDRVCSDDKVYDLPRVMRLPGYWHRKKEPRMTRLLSADAGRVYDFALFTAAVQRQPIVPRMPALPRVVGTASDGHNRSRTNNSPMNARLRGLLRRHGGLTAPAVDALLAEAVVGNRHETLKTVVGKLGSRAWSADEITAFVLPRINQQWGDGDWSEHLASVVDWAVGRDLERGVELGKIWSSGSFGGCP